MKRRFILILLLALLSLSACSGTTSESEREALQAAYDQGWYDAISHIEDSAQYCYDIYVPEEQIENLIWEYFDDSYSWEIRDILLDPGNVDKKTTLDIINDVIYGMSPDTYYPQG